MTGAVSTRRAFLRRAGFGAAGLAVGGPALLAACSSSVSRQHEVRVYNQPLAIDDNTRPLFELASGVFLRYHEYVDPVAYLRSVSPALRRHRDIGADVVVVPDLQTAQMIEAGFVRPLPFHPSARLPPAFANPRFDPGRRFSLPWSSSVVGLAYDRRRVHEPIRSAGALFDPRFAGNVVLSADPAATLGLVMFASGGDPAVVTEAEAEAALRRVRTAVAGGQVHSFATTDYIDDLVSGRALLAIARSDEIRDARQVSPTLDFIVPTEGGLLESTNMVIPIGTPNVGDASTFIDFMFSPTANSRLASFGSRVPTVAHAVDALQGIDPKAALDRLVVPDPATWARLKIWGGTAATDRATSAFASLAATHGSRS